MYNLALNGHLRFKIQGHTHSKLHKTDTHIMKKYLSSVSSPSVRLVPAELAELATLEEDCVEEGKSHKNLLVSDRCLVVSAVGGSVEELEHDGAEAAWGFDNHLGAIGNWSVGDDDIQRKSA